MKNLRLSGFVLVAVILVVTLVLGACAKTTPTTTTAAPAPTSASSSTTTAPKTTAPSSTTTPAKTTAPSPTTATPQYGGIYKIIRPGVTLTNIGIPGAPIGQVMDRLVGLPAIESLLCWDIKGNILPRLATAWEFSPDYKSITFTLRQGVKFHDGTDFNAEAAKYNLDLWRGASIPDLKSVSSVDIIDNYKIRLNISTYEPGFISSLCYQSGSMMSPTSLKTHDKEYNLMHAVGTGPFKQVSIDRNTGVKYERFNDYWQKGKPYLDGIEWIFTADATTALMGFKTGAGQTLIGIEPKDCAGLIATGKFRIGTCQQSGGGIAGDSKTMSSIFADTRVLQAIAYATDFSAITKALGYGYYVYSNQPALQANNYYNPAIVGYPYNPQKAKDLLKEAGYPNGFQTTMLFQNTSFKTDFYTMVQSYLKEVGITLKLDPADANRYVQGRQQGWTGLMDEFLSNGITSDMSRQFLDKFSSKRTKLVSTYIPDIIDTKIQLAAIERDENKRAEIFKEVDKLIIDEYCLFIPTYVTQSLIAKSLKVNGCFYGEVDVAPWDPADVWLSK